MKKINLCLLGASKIASKILPSIRMVEEFNSISVAARHFADASRFAETNNISATYKSYKECLDDPKIDAVYISTLNSNHVPLAEESLLAGKHVLCEKPLALKKSDAEKIFRIAKDKNLVLLEGFMYRFSPAFIKIKQLISDKVLGEIKSVKVGLSFSFYDENAYLRGGRATSAGKGGALADLGCYCVDFMTVILGTGLKIESLAVISKHRKEDPTFDQSTRAMIQFSDNVSAFLECSVENPSVNNWEVSGTKASASLLRFNPNILESTDLRIIDKQSQLNIISCPGANCFELEFRNFARSILRVEIPHISAGESIQNAALLEQVSAKAAEIKT